jgi:hypothetical protein
MNISSEQVIIQKEAVVHLKAYHSTSLKRLRKPINLNKNEARIAQSL